MPQCRGQHVLNAELSFCSCSVWRSVRANPMTSSVTRSSGDAWMSESRWTRSRSTARISCRRPSCARVSGYTGRHGDKHRHTHQFQQKQAFVRDSLDALLQSLRSVRESSSSSCQILILETLEHGVKNHLLIVNALERRARTSDQQMSTSSPEPHCKAHKAASLTQTLSFYGRLVRGPVELLVESLQHTCAGHTHDT
ncbi:uncharacterized protein LOC127495858 isoform X2 [Ctenopharyngodon idella]|uniref:uncharacterized protein LOC127495858 isoform X2 n=1 Tax=Ctenopharyngodon idella TaxID=7959 RepID=UPI00222E0606|nr:uncharacterized protein LOC127495858 isoform X2 [Ctenopharyngodon idella]